MTQAERDLLIICARIISTLMAINMAHKKDLDQLYEFMKKVDTEALTREIKL